MFRLTTLLTLAVVAFWGLGLWIDPPAFNGRGYVHELFYLTGVVAWVYMALILVIAARPSWIERVTKTSLDKLYLWHKWLAMATIVLSFVHYFTKIWGVPLVNAVWTLPKPEPFAQAADYSLLETIWRALRSPAVWTSEWLTWAMLVLILLCFVQRLSYRSWLKTHTLFAVIFIGLTLHSVRLMETEDFLLPMGWINLVATAAGFWASCVILLGKVGNSKRVQARVSGFETSPEIFKLKLDAHFEKVPEPGQFVFLQIGSEPPHPFSIAAADENGIELAVKKLGDFTRELAQHVKVGDVVTLEGPWGGFKPVASREPQAWVALGVGIVPFLTWLRNAQHEKLGAVTLFWCVKDRAKEVLVNEVMHLAEAANVKLVLLDKTCRRLTDSDVLATRPVRVAVCGKGAIVDRVKLACRKNSIEFERVEFQWR